MTKNNLKLFSYFIIAIILTLGLSISLQSVLAVWTAPTASPPQDNIPAPINTSIQKQTKSGDLIIAGDLDLGGNFSVDLPNSIFFVDHLTGNVGIGTSSPQDMLHLVGGDNKVHITLSEYGGSGNSPDIYFQRARGTASAPQSLNVGDNVGSIDFYGYNNNGFSDSAEIVGKVEGLGTSVRSGIAFFTINDSDLSGERVRIDRNGNVGIGTNNPNSTTKLHIVQDPLAYQLIEGTTAGALVLGDRDGAGDKYFTVWGTEDTLTLGSMTNDLTAFANNIVIDRNNHVGINIAPSGTYDFEVSGDIHATGDITCDGS